MMVENEEALTQNDFEMNNDRRFRFIRKYFNISIVTLVAFLILFGIVVIKAFTAQNPSTEDSGLGMFIMIFFWPVILTSVLLLICTYFLYRKTKKEMERFVFAFLSVLVIPVALFGFFTVVALVRGLIVLLIHF